MLQKGYFVTAELRVKEHGRIREAREALKMLCAETIREPGCTLFCLHECSEEPGRFLLWERFNDEDAFKHHFSLPHTKSYIERDLTDVAQYFQTNIISA